MMKAAMKATRVVASPVISFMRCCTIWSVVETWRPPADLAPVSSVLTSFELASAFATASWTWATSDGLSTKTRMWSAAGYRFETSVAKNMGTLDGTCASPEIVKVWVSSPSPSSEGTMRSTVSPTFLFCFSAIFASYRSSSFWEGAWPSVILMPLCLGHTETNANSSEEVNTEPCSMI